MRVHTNIGICILACNCTQEYPLASGYLLGVPPVRPKNARSSTSHARHDPLLSAAVGGILRDLRLSRALTQEQLAWETGIERAFISEIERGVKGVSLTMLYRLAVGLSVKPQKIIAALDAVMFPKKK